MSNKRNFKKEIRYVCGDLAAETIFAGYKFKGFTHEVVTDIICDIARLQVKSLANCSFCFDKTVKDFPDKKAYNKARNDYFKAAFERAQQDFIAGVEQVVSKMNAARKA